MNWKQITDNWEEFRVKVKEKWDKITDDDLTSVAGKRGPLAALLEVRYGYDKNRVERELNDFTQSLELEDPPVGPAEVPPSWVEETGVGNKAPSQRSTS